MTIHNQLSKRSFLLLGIAVTLLLLSACADGTFSSDDDYEAIIIVRPDQTYDFGAQTTFYLGPVVRNLLKPNEVTSDQLMSNQLMSTAEWLHTFDNDILDTVEQQMNSRGFTSVDAPQSADIMVIAYAVSRSDFTYNGKFVFPDDDTMDLGLVSDADHLAYGENGFVIVIVDKSFHANMETAYVPVWTAGIHNAPTSISAVLSGIEQAFELCEYVATQNTEVTNDQE